ncbi:MULTISPECIES: helix-turn-helix transcriptional regulator [Streptomyces]|uniref:AAA family ATPase n=3 Tax=Streptomyces TaxID=1883 RepID=A0ABD5ELG6_9ACTN|nr:MULTISPECIES: LuxR family transcriptional regulator [unclassified Streptomyces]MDT0435491.1 AAA family ATPase [Streptomyces sp. DSM 41981]MYQ67895.1 AAA family ATPase [Streptomyces sp. SID4950]SCE41120.1 regulatory protein, luxR family [Streptomyces sp. SolWspMP-5a-2]
MSERARTDTPAPPLVGRTRHLDALARYAAAARAGQPRLVLVDGPAGAGKTALLRAAVAEDGPFAGMTVLHGGCRAVDAATGYSGVRALFTRLGLTSRKGRASHLLDGAARRALPALAADPETLESLGAAPEGTFSVLQGLYWLTVNLMSEGPLVLVLDDAHWCDERSLRWLDFLLRRADGLPLLVVAAHRTEAGLAAPDALADLAAHHLPATLRLGPLDTAEITELVGRVFPGHQPEPAFVGRLVSVTGGSPLEAVRLLRDLCAAGLGPDDAGTRQIAEVGGRVVAASVQAALANQPGWVREVLLAVAVLGDEDTAYLAALVGVSALHVEEGVEILRQAGLVQRARREPVHDLVRAAVLDTLGPAGTAELRMRAARLLSDIGRSPEETAAQLLAVPGPGDAWTTSVLRAAATQAEQRGAPEATARYLERVREAEPDDPDVLTRLGKALAETDPRRSVDLLHAAHARTTDVRARTATAVQLALTCLSVQRSADGTRVLTEALDDLDAELGAAPEPVDRELRTLAESALLIVGADEKSTLPDVLRRTAGLVPPPGDTPAQRQQLAMLSVLAAVDGQPVAESVRRARSALRAPGVPLGVWSLLPASLALSLADENRAASDALETVLRGSRDTAAVWTYVLALSTRALYRLENGEVADALADAQTSLEILGQERWGDSTTMPHTAYAAALAERGETARAEEALAAVKRPRFDRFAWEYHWYLMARGRVRAARGDLEGALEEFRTCGDSLASAGLGNPVFAPWWLEAACLLGGLGRTTEALEAAGHGARLAERWDTPRARGYAALAVGAATPGPAGTERLRGAVTLLESSPARAHHARALLLLGRAVLADGEVREARDHLREAVGLARRSGCVALARQAREDLVAAGGRMREITASPLDMLTGTERTVAGLVASGAGNREVAESLFVTVRTIELHLTSVYRKLGVNRRADLTEALRAGGPPPPVPPRPGI